MLKATIINNLNPHSHKEGPVYITITLSKQKKSHSLESDSHSHQNSNFSLTQFNEHQTKQNPDAKIASFFATTKPSWKMENLNPSKRSEHSEDQKEQNFIIEGKKRKLWEH